MFSISGSIDIKPGVSVSALASLICVRNVSSASPDDVYRYGKGSIILDTKTFTLNFDAVPPVLELNDYSSRGLPSLGVEVFMLVVVKNTQPHNIGEADTSTFHGVVSNHGVLYIGGGSAMYLTDTGRTWPSLFQNRYGMGLGVRQQTGYDTFAQSTGPIILKIPDVLSDIEFPDWT
jgi:hypothetical protein